MTITPGNYRTRSGLKAIVLAIIPTELNTDLPLLGYIKENGLTKTKTWTLNGEYLCVKLQHELDLIEPWTDPVPWDWSTTCPWFNYLAMDDSGEWFLYSNKPSLSAIFWTYDSSNIDCTEVPKEYYPKWTGDWTKSLTKRP